MSGTDEFSTYSADLSGPALNFAAVTPSDVLDMPYVSRGLYVGNGGDLTLVSKSGAVVRFANVASGQVLPVRALRVNAAGTTATDIVELW